MEGGEVVEVTVGVTVEDTGEDTVEDTVVAVGVAVGAEDEVAAPRSSSNRGHSRWAFPDHIEADNDDDFTQILSIHKIIVYVENMYIRCALLK